MSPTIFKVKGYEFGFFSSDKREPPHMHVRYGNKAAKFWLSQVRLAWNRGFAKHELTEIRQILREHRDVCLQKWRDFFEQS